MKKSHLILSVLFMLHVSTLFSQIDYVELVIPPELQDNPKAIEYLTKDVKQLNRMFHALDEFAIEFEDLALIISKVDTNDVNSIETYRPQVEAKVMSLSGSMVKFSLNLMWYFGKDIFADEDATKRIIEKLDTEEGVAFRKSMNHVRMKKDLLEARAKEFMERLEAM